MLKKFCPRCAKETNDLFEGLCSDCYLEKKKIADVPQNVRVLLCRCGRSNEKKKWVSNPSIEVMIERVVGASVVKDKDVSVKIKYEPFMINGKTVVPVTVLAEKNIDGRLIEKGAVTNLVIVPQSCENCSRLSGGYYEAVIQIRAPKNMQDQILILIKDKVNQYKDADMFSFITQVQASKDGTDVYLGSAKIAQKVEQETKRIYNVTTKITHSIQGVKDGKEIKRMTVLLRASD
ncbi:MAG: NMD3-related protein [archaeon]